MRRYNPKEIEPKWQKTWDENRLYRATEDTTKPKRYILEYFPYPSGAAMHVGHVRNYTIGDAVARFYRMRGYNVLHPMGWDAFGLPAENYAIKHNISPQQAIQENTGHFKQQLTQMGFSYDWEREINSSDPAYYRWTQWFFLLLHKRGLAYQKESLQWWCETDKTVLANEQVEAGKCWRCGNEVVKKSLKQWFFKITAYADRLVDDLEDLDWSDAIKAMQRNWIGKSVGAEIDFTVEGIDEPLRVFTTRPDTVFGATFMVLAPEHPLVSKFAESSKKEQVENYCKEAQSKSDIERQENRDKTGIFTGAYAKNPANGELIPVWVADYVLMGYGTGAIMAVPAHDERDYEFAKKFNLPIVPVIAQDFGKTLPDATAVTGVVVVGYDPSTDKYLALKNNGKTWLVAGGKETDETFEAAARRELAEEAGYHNVKDVIQLGSPIYSSYYNRNKGSNRRSFAYSYLAIVDRDDQQETRQEAHENFSVQWVDFADLQTGITRIGTEAGHWIETLSRAKDAIEAYRKGEAYESSAFQGEGVLINSGEYNGLSSESAREKIVTELAGKNLAREKVQYKIRDWLISRQRYWGAPIPMVHCPKDGPVPVPEDQLPVELPAVESYQPTGDGRSPLARDEDFVHTTCPTCGGPAERETDTMDGFACSSWYYLRFADPNNAEQPFDPGKAKFWLPVDDYIGGAEHAVMHLLYARMWTKVLYDEGMLHFHEPFTALRNQGMILAPDGRKMSKSWNNVISPDELIDKGYGADSVRLMELFIGPWDQSANWSVEGMGGVYRFLQRAWTLTQEYLDEQSSEITTEPTASSKVVTQAVHETISKVSHDLHNMAFNTAIAALMECMNTFYKIKSEHGFSDRETWQAALVSFVQLLAPFAPHIAEELWQDLGQNGSVHTSDWPVHDPIYLEKSEETIVIQVNGKVRGNLTMPADAAEDEVVARAKQHKKVRTYLDGATIKKTIHVPHRLVNFVV